jgi:hypothetical protein
MDSFAPTVTLPIMRKTPKREALKAMVPGSYVRHLEYGKGRVLRLLWGSPTRVEVQYPSIRRIHDYRKLEPWMDKRFRDQD